MNDKVENLILEHLRGMRSDIADLKQGQRHTNERLAAIEHHMAGLYTASVNHTDEMDYLRRRVERLERRLEITDEIPLT
jgi:ubiquinone biosynthesis protein UbiJ